MSTATSENLNIRQKNGTGLDTVEHQHDTLSKLKPAMQAAIRLLSSGKGIAETARAIGRGRTTIHRWLREDAGFGVQNCRYTLYETKL